MRICIATPAPAHSRKGNRITALRWSRLLRELGHRVTLDTEYRGQPCDLLLALHARRSFPSVERFHREQPGLPLLLALTGTDLYQDIRTSEEARQSLELATQLIVLQPLGIEELPEHLRGKARVIYQSVEPVPRAPRKAGRWFDICVMGHLRPVKDPFRTALAARRLPPESRIRVLHVGGALSEEMEALARQEAEENPRYQWLGELPRGRARAVLARSRLLSLTSEMEGGANVISEAVVAGVPVVASRISGTLGLLGPDYPALFPVGDTAALTELLRRVETDPYFYNELSTRCARLAPLFDPAHERATWAALLCELE